MSDDTTAVTAIPRALETYPSGADQTLAADLAMRVQIEPFNAIATGVLLLAILHTFAAARFARLAHRVQHRHDEEAQAHGRPASPSLCAEALHFLGEVEVVFGLWAVVLLVATTAYAGGRRPGTTSAKRSTTRNPCSWSSSWGSRRRGRSLGSLSQPCGVWRLLVAPHLPPGGWQF